MTKLREADAEQRRLNGAGPDFSEALARGLQVVTAFADTMRPMSLADVARAVDLPKATVRRAIHTLVHLGYVEADGRLFRITPQILRLAHAYLVSNMVSTVLQPACERIARETMQGCSGAILDKAEVVMIARALPAQGIPVGAGIGFRLPAVSSALGRVLLGALPKDHVERYLAGRLQAETPFTVTDPDKLRQTLAQVGEQGYAYVDQEAEFGFRSIAVPVRKFDGSVVAALNIGGHIDGVSPDTMIHDYLPLLRRVAEELRKQLV